MSTQCGKLKPTSSWDPFGRLGHPSKFQRVSHLASVTARHSSSERQPNFAAFNRERHLYSAGWPSHWALPHFVVLSISRHIYISKASNHRTPAFISVHVSAEYSGTLRTKHFVVLFFSSDFILLVNNLFLSIKAFLAVSILLWISFSQYQSADIKLPRYLNYSTCSDFCPSIHILSFVFCVYEYTSLLSFSQPNIILHS